LVKAAAKVVNAAYSKDISGRVTAAAVSPERQPRHPRKRKPAKDCSRRAHITSTFSRWYIRSKRFDHDDAPCIAEDRDIFMNAEMQGAGRRYALPQGKCSWG
jgi:hypothetical protein